MGTKMKGIFKGFKYISQIFVYKEHEMEIGHPTDVRHVAHIGWDVSSMNTPSWMNEYKTAAEFSSTSLTNFGQPKNMASWTSDAAEFSSTSLTNFGQPKNMASWTSDEYRPAELLQQGGSDPFAASPARETPPPKASRRKKAKGCSAGKSSKPPKLKTSADKLAQKHVEPQGNPDL